MVGLTEIKKVQGQGSWAKHEIRKADDLILDVMRFLFSKGFDEQYDKLLKAKVWLSAAEESLKGQWELLEDYWHEEATTDEWEET